jgi:DNA-binding LytR/AlgR family response regulator
MSSIIQNSPFRGLGGKIKCIITDDEPLARKGLKSYIDKIDFLELTAVCEDAIQLNNAVKSGTVDLLFLDIEMPYITGIEFLQQTKNPPKVIFTTAYEKYAVKGYELDVLDYLLKPISFDRFLKSANKAFDYFNQPAPAERNYIFIKTGSRLEKINFDEILFIEAMENYVGIYLQDKKLLAHSTLKSMLDSLPSTNFIQTHKSYIVNSSFISSIEGSTLHVAQYEVPISRQLKDEVMQRVLNDKLAGK